MKKESNKMMNFWPKVGSERVPRVLDLQVYSENNIAKINIVELAYTYINDHKTCSSNPSISIVLKNDEYNMNNKYVNLFRWLFIN